MEQLTILSITRPHGTFKWTIIDGLVVSNQGARDEIAVEEPCSPREFLARNRKINLINSGRDKVLSALVMTRHVDDNPEAEKPYYWVVDERLDRDTM